MKTPIQQLLSELNDKYPSFFNLESKDGRERIKELEKYIELEEKAFFAIGSACLKTGIDIGIKGYTYDSTKVLTIISNYKNSR